jgi:transposase
MRSYEASFYVIFSIPFLLYLCYVGIFSSAKNETTNYHGALSLLIRKVSVSNISQEKGYSELFRGFPQSPELDAVPSTYTIRHSLSLYYSTLCIMHLTKCR